MGEMHGPEATIIMRNELGYEGLIIGVTGYARAEEISIFRNSGANAVLTKPLTPQKFTEELQVLGFLSRC